jgi:cytochrome c peroxidase
MTLRMRNAYISLAAAITLIAAATALRSEDGDGATDRDRIPAAARKEIKAVELEIDRIEAESLHKAQSTTLDRFQQITLLGKLIFYDQQLSVKRNESCSFCHMPETGFSGPVSALNQMTGSYPGSIRTRFSGRRPQSHTYAGFAPVLHYNPGQGDFVGGQFWDMRATGLRLESALAEQAQGPPLDPNEMGLIDPACMVYRMSQRPYRGRAAVVTVAMISSPWTDSFGISISSHTRAAISSGRCRGRNGLGRGHCYQDLVARFQLFARLVFVRLCDGHRAHAFGFATMG